jgi:hypothetical protein
MNADGYADIIIGAPYYSWPSYSHGGRARFYLTSSTGSRLPVLHAQITGFSNEVHLGTSVAIGERLVEGHADIVVGAPDGSGSYQNVQLWKYTQ